MELICKSEVAANTGSLNYSETKRLNDIELDKPFADLFFLLS